MVLNSNKKLLFKFKFTGHGECYSKFSSYSSDKEWSNGSYTYDGKLDINNLESTTYAYGETDTSLEKNLVLKTPLNFQNIPNNAILKKLNFLVLYKNSSTGSGYSEFSISISNRKLASQSRLDVTRIEIFSDYISKGNGDSIIKQINCEIDLQKLIAKNWDNISFITNNLSLCLEVSGESWGECKIYVYDVIAHMEYELPQTGVFLGDKRINIYKGDLNISQLLKGNIKII